MGKKLTGNFEASREIIQWAESCSGMMTTIKTKYGGVSQMLEDASWDESKTEYAMNLIAALRDTITRVATEMKEHEEGKPYKRARRGTD